MKSLAVVLLVALAPSVRAELRVHALAAGSRTIPVAEGSLLVRFKAPAAFPRSAQAAALGALGGRRLRESYGWTVVRLPASMSVEAALAGYAARPEVLAVLPDRVYRPQRVPDDPSFPSQYHLSRIGAPGAWEFDVGGSSRVTIAVVDTGIDGTHPDLSGNLQPSLNESFDSNGLGTPENPPTDSCGHGTEVAGTAAASTDNGIGVAGVSWRAKLLSLRVFSPADCSTGVQDSVIASAIDYAVTAATVTNPAAIGHLVVNLSLGAVPNPNCDSLMAAAIRNAQAKGVLVVAAGGNGGPGTDNPGRVVTCPAALPGVVAVAATDQNDDAAGFSAVGPELSVAAPGVAILTTAKGGGYRSDDGTSFASPIVAGLGALLWSAVPALSSGTVVTILEQTADDLGSPGFDASYGWGRVNAFRALRRAVRGTLSGFAGESRAIAFPNPARFSQGSVSFAVPQSVAGSGLSVKVYTQAGELVRTLNGLVWDGKNDSGLPAASGVYIFLVQSDRGQARGRVAVLR